MARNLRRSRRAGATNATVSRTAKSASAYSVDDIVEINRGNATVKARLAELLTDSSSSNPRWLIKFDGLPLKDEEVYEHAFATTSSDNSDDDSDNSYSIGAGGQRYGDFSSDNDDTMNDGGRHSRVRRHHPHSQHYGHSSSNLPAAAAESGGNFEPAKDKRAKARESRSKRRQAIIDEDMTSFCQSQPNHKRFRLLAPPPPNFQHPNRAKGGKRGNNNNNHHDDDGEEVVQVKLLTGTLMLYKGLHRRAEFIRKV